jgi:ADP-heptose:LPS heptosyltransferase
MTQPSPANTNAPQGGILVIKLGALGDFLVAQGCFAAIRAYHRHDRITLLTRAAYAELGWQCGHFDDVLIDTRLSWRSPGAYLGFLAELRRRRFARVYDLQRNARLKTLYYLLRAGRRLEWSGVFRGCSHYVADPPEDRRHAVDKWTSQIEAAGIPAVPPPRVDWLKGDAARFGLARPFALLVPGGAPRRPRKRWPASHYAALARHLVERGIAPVVIGTAAEAAAAAEIRSLCPSAVSLLDRTSFGDIADLARGAVFAVGNDTGPMHLISLAGCPVVSLYSDESDPDLTKPQGARVTVLRRSDLRALDVADVVAVLPGPAT